MAMMNEMEYRTIGSALAGGYRAAVYCRLSKDDDLQGESASIDVYKRQEKGSKNRPGTNETQTTGYGTLTGTCHFQSENVRCFFLFKEG